MLDPLECLFNPPATVVQLGKRGGWKGGGIEKRDHHDMHTSVRCYHVNQANRGRRSRAFLVLGITGIGRTRDDELVTSAGLKELAYHSEYRTGCGVP